MTDAIECMNLKRQIIEIEKDVESIRHLSDDMSDLVSHQEERMSLIEDFANSSKTDTKLAVKELEQASEYQLSSRKMTLGLVVLGITFVNVPLGIAFGLKVGLIGTGCCIGLGAVTTLRN